MHSRLKKTAERASALQVTLALALISISAILFASSLKTAPSAAVVPHPGGTVLMQGPQQYQSDAQGTSQEQIQAPSIIGTCDTAGPVEVEATAGMLGPTAYANLAAAIAAINAGTHQGVINVELCASTTETGSMFLNSNTAAPASYTSVTIRPLADGLTVAGPTVAGRGLIELNGADNVTIDGDNPNSSGTNRNLTVQNTAANTVAFTSVIRVALNTTTVASADNITIKNVNLLGSATGRNISSATGNGTEDTTYGILAAGSASGATTAPTAIASNSTTIGAGATASNLTIQNNSFNAAARAVAVQGSATTVFPGMLIQDNVIGNATAGAIDQIYAFGITAQGSADGIIRRNTVYVEGYINSSITAVGIDVGSGTFKIEKNMVLRARNNNGATFPATGINLGGGIGHIVQNNFITDVRNNQTSGTGAFGVSGIVAGIRIYFGNSGGEKIYHNSVYLCGAIPGANGQNLVAALMISSATSTGIDVRNNIFSNTMTGGNPAQTNTRLVAIYLPSGATSAMNLTLNNNDYVEGTDANSRMAQVGTVTGTGEYTAANFNPGATVPATNFRAYTSSLRPAGTNDLASKSVNPLVVSCTDLHLTSSSPMIDYAVDVGVTDDVDGDPRPNCTIPDIGADEFIQNVCGATPTPAPTETPTPTPTPTATPNCVITQSSSQTITPGNSFSCNGGSPNFFHSDNSYWRVFNLGIGGHNITSVSFGTETATANPAVGTQPVTVRLYTQFPPGAFPGCCRQQIATTTVNIPNQTATVLTVPLAVNLTPETPQLIMEVFTPNGQPPVNNSFIIGSNAAAQSGPSYISAAACGLSTPTDLATIGFPNMHIVFNVNATCAEISPTPGPTATPTATPPQITISGTVIYCSGNPVPGVTLTQTGTFFGETSSNGSGNYTLTGLPAGGNYVVTPSKAARTPGSAGINGTDVLAVRRHYLNIELIPAGCRRTAADVNGDANINGVDVTAIQRFFLGFTSGTANVGKYQFTPANRTYTRVTSNQTAQNYDALVFGDVNSVFVHRPGGNGKSVISLPRRSLGVGG